jgi:hypothetical protein
MPTRVKEEEFSVCQFFPDDSYEYTRRYVAPEEALKAFYHYTTSVGAKVGTTVRVILTDGGDCTVVEWVRGKGYTNDGVNFSGVLKDALK